MSGHEVSSVARGFGAAKKRDGEKLNIRRRRKKWWLTFAFLHDTSLVVGTLCIVVLEFVEVFV
jgi:hypothetical protein